MACYLLCARDCGFIGQRGTQWIPEGWPPPESPVQSIMADTPYVNQMQIIKVMYFIYRAFSSELALQH